MSFGNKIGLKIDQKLTEEDLFYPFYGDMILEVKKDVAIGQDMGLVIGTTIRKPDIFIGDSEIAIEEMIREWSKPLEKVFPTASGKDGSFEGQQYTYGNQIKRSKSIAKPKIFIPVFPGTNCEYDTAKAFEKAGGKVEIQVFRNMTVNDLEDAMNLMVRKINEAQIISLPGGFSAGDEPEGSGKFIAAVFRNPAVSEATMNLLKKRDGLVIGICNGFQALVKLGLVQYGEIKILEEDTPTLTYNQIGRHISRFVNTKVSSNLSPWLNNCQVGDIHAIPISHGEGRFHASDEWLERLIQNGQVACQYVDENGKPTMNENDNPNGSMAAIEALTSPDGRVLGKMAHSERIGVDLHKNIPGNKNQQIFEAGIKYYL
jgi:phosphoribosylformylglycinamidine synthase